MFQSSGSSPTASMVVEPATGTEVADNPMVIDVTEADLPALRNRPANSFAGRFSSHAPAPSQSLSVGDQVVITIFRPPAAVSSQFRADGHDLSRCRFLYQRCRRRPSIATG